MSRQNKNTNQNSKKQIILAPKKNLLHNHIQVEDEIKNTNEITLKEERKKMLEEGVSILESLLGRGNPILDLPSNNPVFLLYITSCFFNL
jgi:hypothetical protein